MPTLFRRFSSLSLIEKQTPARWHQEIVRTANGQLPVPLASDGISIFPWAQLRVCTDTYMRKKRFSVVELDSFLSNLIQSHSDQVVALAACAHLLSRPARQAILAAFASDRRDPSLYFQAFIAAYHEDEHTTAADRSWAQTLVPLCAHAAAKTLMAKALRNVLYHYNDVPLPSDMLLRERVKTATTEACQTASLKLQICSEENDWNEAVPWAQVLSTYASNPIIVSASVLQLLNENIPGWQSWASWKIMHIELCRWQSLKNDKRLGCFWNLLGPDSAKDDNVNFSSVANRVVYTDNFIPWLEANGFLPGPGLFFLDRHQMDLFKNSLFNIIHAVSERGIAEQFFLRVLDTHGLDGDSLQLWRLASTSIGIHAPKFMEAVMNDDRTMHTTLPILTSGLQILSADNLGPLRAFLQDMLHDLVQSTGNNLRNTFVETTKADRDFRSHAKDLFSFRQLIKFYPDLRDIEITGLDLKYITPLSQYDINALHNLHMSLAQSGDVAWDMSRKFVNAQISGHGEPGYQDDIMEQLFAMWKTDSSEYCRLLAIKLAFWPPTYQSALLARSGYYISSNDRVNCMQDITSLPRHLVQNLHECIEIASFEIPKDIEKADVCRRVVRIVAEVIEKSSSKPASWRGMVGWIMSVYDVTPQTAHTFTSCVFSEYRKWIKNLQTIYVSEVPTLNEAVVWTSRLMDYSSTLERLEGAQGSQGSMDCILMGSREPTATYLDNMLQAMEQQRTKARLDVMDQLAISLSDNARFAKLISNAIVRLAEVSDLGFNLCQRLACLAVQESPQVAVVQMEIWIRLPDMEHTTITALTALGQALRLPSSLDPEVATCYMLQRIELVMNQARRLEEMRMHVRRSDKDGVAAMFAKLNIQSTMTPMEDELMDLPIEISNNVENPAEDVIEIRFALSHLNDIYRNAMGIQKDVQLYIRLAMGSRDQWKSFCVHTNDPQDDDSTSKHTTCGINVLKSPNVNSCSDSGTNRLEYFISRRVWDMLKSVKVSHISVLELYRKIEAALKTFGNNCIVCNASLGAYLYRPTLCTNQKCFTVFLKSSLQLRLADVELNQPVVKLLLTGIYASATTMSRRATTGVSQLDLMPSCPDRLNDPAKLLALMNQLPLKLQTFDVRESILTLPIIRKRLLLSYACNSYRGFLVSATGSLKIPNLPGVLQFVVVDNAPQIMSAFAKHDNVQPRQVYFHGTSMDRLWPILSQGLKILSNTNLMTHAAAHGVGIYLADEPSTALGYAQKHPAASSPGAFATINQAYVTKEVLLGVEYAGDDTNQTHGIHVATDPTKVLLRYVFLVPPGYHAPPSQQLRPAMLSSFSTLRGGARVY